MIWKGPSDSLNWESLETILICMMEDDDARVVDRQQSRTTIKVHVQICSQLQNLIIRVSKIIPEIEAARPRAFEALCQLNDGIAKAKSLFQQCCESSILYLAFRGDNFVSRCKISSNILESSLSKIQDMVPVVLANKISAIITVLTTEVFHLDPSEEEAGKMLRELLHNYSSSEEFRISAIQAVCSCLQISSRNAIMIEKRSLRKMIDKLGDNEQVKRKILNIFLGLLNKYRDIITTTEDINDSELSSFANPYNWERVTSSMYSDSSLGSSMSNLNLAVDFNNLSLGHDGQDEYSVGSSSNAVEEVKRLLNISEKSWSMMPFGKFIEMLIKFLNDARESHNVDAQLKGLRSLLGLLQEKRSNVLSYIKENVYVILASFLDTEVAEEALSILEVLSSHQNCVAKFASSGATDCISNILESRNQQFLERALNILVNLSVAHDLSFFITPSELIPKFVPLIGNVSLARHCVAILKNLCENGVSIAETDGCMMIRLVAHLLENGGRDEQEHAVFVLLHLCPQRPRYCQLVMDEGVITGLCNVSVNGNSKTVVMATEVMRIIGRCSEH